MTDAQPTAPYRVLARKYRPTRFADLIGQEAMVRTLSNAIAAGRIAHAFVLTGVRGIGKTTTARIIARVLNCVGPDGKGGPTIDPCGVCEHCVAIAEDRHMDVIEMDAASRTGVEDIRELIDGVRYRPVSARYKIYIVDEVHMLSKNAFNALLKTLEEPPEHVKFVFATTEIRRVPITVLSRCQRFDLRRVDQAMLAKHLQGVAEKEGRKVSDGAASLLGRAADGSVRDGLSLLDRALAHVEGEVADAPVRELLGLADRTQTFDLFEAVMKGDAERALAQLGTLYRAGADPVVVLQDLLDLTHWLTRLKAAPSLADDAAVPEAERARGGALAKALGVPVLTRTWQMLLKGLAEAQAAPSPLAAVEMLMVRLAYAAELPSPGDLVASLKDGNGAGAPAGSPARGVDARASAMPSGPRGSGPGSGGGVAQARRMAEPEPAASTAPVPTAQAAMPDPRTFEEVVMLFAARREGILHALLLNNVHLVRFESGRIDIHAPDTPRDFASKLMTCLERWTGRRWLVTLVTQPSGDPTLAQQAATRIAEAKAHAAQHPLVAAVLAAFPNATIEAVRGGKDRPGTGDGDLSFDSGETPDTEDT
jgi:DNA polymerase-3 subunit gamma/tau